MTTSSPPRRPQMFDADDPALRPSEPSPQESRAADDDAFDTVPADTEGLSQQAAGEPLSRGIRWGGLLLSAMTGLFLLAAGVWFARFTSVALARQDWVGWLAQALLGLLILAVVVLLLKELVGIFRLRRLTRIRSDASKAIADADRQSEERAVRSLKSLARSRSDAKWNLAEFRQHERHMQKNGALLGLADRVLLAEPDKQARRVVFESARRVGVVTAVVPVAFLVMLFVLTENVRMVRRLAAAYGGRPGFLGGMRLLWRVILHVAASGAIALTDDLFGQFLGQDIVRRLSRRLGEGAFVGALTARLGVAAIEVCRPLPYIEVAPLRSRHIVRELFPELKPAEMMRSALGKNTTSTRPSEEA
ncbi:MAG: TIGR01620 family protein [Hyphomicrobiaceae bacterium]